MPYSSTKDLPAQTKSLTAKEKRAFLKAFNSAVAAGKSEAVAFRIAWKAAKETDDDKSRSFPAKKRKKLAEEGKALPDGSFPIVTKADLKNAIQAYGRASNKAAVKRHIKKRARALGATNLLPDDWKNGDSAMDETTQDASSSFSDTMSALRRVVRKEVGRRSYLADAGPDWLVYERYDEEAGEYVLFRRSYSGDGASITLGDDATEVLRTTVYVPVSKQDSASGLVEIWGATMATPHATSMVDQAASSSYTDVEHPIHKGA